MTKETTPKKTFKDTLIKHSTAVVFWGGLLILAGAYFLWLSPLKDSAVQEIMRTDDLTARLQQKQAELTGLQELEKAYNALDQARIQKLESLITQGADLPRLYVRFDRLISAYGLKMDSINAQIVAKPAKDAVKDLGVINVKLKISQADYSKIKALLRAIENSSEVMYVVKASWPEKIDKLDLELNTYYLK